MHLEKIAKELYETLYELYDIINYTKYEDKDTGEKCYGVPKRVSTVWYGEVKYSNEFREKIEKTIKNYEDIAKPIKLSWWKKYLKFKEAEERSGGK